LVQAFSNGFSLASAILDYFGVCVWYMDYPQSLQETNLTDWSRTVVPDGAHKGKTFKQVIDAGAGSRYRNRKCGSDWAKSLCGYVKVLDEDKGKDVTGENHKDEDRGKIDQQVHGKALDHQAKQKEDDEWEKVDADNEKAELHTVVLKVPPGTSVTVNFK
jgi:hypothetical protein